MRRAFGTCQKKALIFDRGILLIDMSVVLRVSESAIFLTVANVMADHGDLPVATSRRSGSFVGV